MASKKVYWGIKIAVLGFVLFFVFNIVLFIASIILGTENPFDFTIGMVVVAIVLSALSFAGALLIKARSNGEIFACSLSWLLIVLVLLLFITIGNQTTGVVFGHWPSYLLFVGIFAGPWLIKFKKNLPKQKA
jgi:hypothetical protein